MGQREQQTLYHFLGQSSNIPQTVTSAPTSADVLPPKDEALVQKPTNQTTESVHDKSRPPKRRAKKITISQNLERQRTLKDGRLEDRGRQNPPASSSEEQPQVTSVEEDLNPSRRKRRRVSAGELNWEEPNRANNEAGQPLKATSNTGSFPRRQQSEEPPNSKGNSTFPEKYQSGTRLCKSQPRTTQTLSAVELPIVHGLESTRETSQDICQSSPPKEQLNAVLQPNLLTPDSTKPAHSDTELQGLGLKEPAVNKPTLKLNPNGKLLSSPINKSRSQSPSRKKGRRKTTNKKGSLGASPVVIKYPVDEDRRESFAKQLDDICNGRARYPPVKPPTPPTSSLSQKPSKPTHPFFLGKPVHRENGSVESPEQNQGSATTESVDKPTHNPTSAPRNKIAAVNATQPSQPTAKQPFSALGISYSKKPGPPRTSNLIEPLWPPRDLFHVVGTRRTVDWPHTSCEGFINSNEKKGKNPLLGVPNSESVLSPLSQRVHATISEISEPTLSATHEVLRRPERYVADGETLQRLVANELSYNCARQNSRETLDTSKILLPDKGCHPSISRLASSIPSSWTAFDKGEFDVLPWTHKYAPIVAEDVLQPGSEVLILRDWLQHLMISSVDTGNIPRDGLRPKQNKPGQVKRNKKRKMADELDGFIVSSDGEASQSDELIDTDEDELSGGVTFMSKRSIQPNKLASSLAKSREKGEMWNAVLISGPSGCGKTASVYAVAKELDFEVFEINAGTRRSAKDILERVGDMTQNHLVHKLNDLESAAISPQPESSATPAEDNSGKQSLMNSFFVQKPNPEKKTIAKWKNKKKLEPEEPKRPRSQKQSLILFEEVDVLFEEDKQFWTGVLALISQSKRPIIMTCNDEGLLPLHDLSLYKILRYRPPPCSLAVDYMLLLAASEGHLLKRKAVSDLYIYSNRDIRASIMELNFWCQMALGSEKSGIDWMLGNFGRSTTLNKRPRVISKNTYLSGMGWYSRDMVCSQGDQTQRNVALMRESVDQWPPETMDCQDTKAATTGAQGSNTSGILDPDSSRSRVKALREKSELTDMQSMLDLVCSTGYDEVTNDILDTSLPPMLDKQRLGYMEGYQLLQADQQVDFSGLSTEIGTTLSVLMKNSLLDSSPEGETSIIEGILKKASYKPPEKMTTSKFHSAFEPIMEIEPPSTPSGRQAAAFENGIAAISEDLAPYIRCIIAFDLRLERRRQELSGLLLQGERQGKRMRTTRASRAALEGGSKASTRRERWFPNRTNTARVLETGGKGWQDLLHSYRERAEAEANEEKEESSESSSESSGDGGV